MSPLKTPFYGVFAAFAVALVTASFANTSASAAQTMEQRRLAEQPTYSGYIQPGNIQPGNIQPGNIQPGNIQPGNIQPNASADLRAPAPLDRSIAAIPGLAVVPNGHAAVLSVFHAPNASGARLTVLDLRVDLPISDIDPFNSSRYFVRATVTGLDVLVPAPSRHWTAPGNVMVGVHRSVASAGAMLAPDGFAWSLGMALFAPTTNDAKDRPMWAFLSPHRTVPGYGFVLRSAAVGQIGAFTWAANFAIGGAVAIPKNSENGSAFELGLCGHYALHQRFEVGLGMSVASLLRTSLLARVRPVDGFFVDAALHVPATDEARPLSAEVALSAGIEW